ncbi:hypothetical protein [Rufibacter quisquiliarum]|uniref:TonB C-terminal domain-containing protein n=1 Tax=Rufibacter quisquiliarum TaxID=1549639 RepID=A0A839GJ02_9BACT|nr:hypothetical protein [Rufibacter quisquiliarum]MBA9078600.1 hypothetical protein [Rufibacter quisquiliarum]
MKHFLLCMGVTLCVTVSALAQPPTAPRRNVRLKPIGKDSVNFAYDQDYYLIEDSCAQIIRQAHYNFKQRKFFGKFRDVSAQERELVLAEGTFTPEGLKTGPFLYRNLNGSLRAKGDFQEDRFTGRWELYDDNGKPQLVFEALPAGVKILEAWDAEGKHTVQNGAGTYSESNGAIKWTGKLLNGTPEGYWKGSRQNDRSDAILISETFKKGAFVKGSGPTGDYKDASRLKLVGENLFPFLNAEKVRLSRVPCNGTARKRYQSAQYKYGNASFSEEIKNNVRAFLSTVDLKIYENELELEGEVNENGRVVRLRSNNAFDMKIVSGLSKALERLPSLEPPLADGKPVTQKIVFHFTFSQGGYRFTYRFLPMAPSN